MEKVTVVVLRPWLDGQKEGDVITLKKIHPSLKTHVRLVNEPVAGKAAGKEQDKKPDGENPNPEGEAPKAETETLKPETETLKPDSKKADKK